MLCTSRSGVVLNVLLPGELRRDAAAGQRHLLRGAGDGWPLHRWHGMIGCGSQACSAQQAQGSTEGRRRRQATLGCWMHGQHCHGRGSQHQVGAHASGVIGLGWLTSAGASCTGSGASGHCVAAAATWHRAPTALREGHGQKNNLAARISLCWHPV